MKPRPSHRRRWWRPSVFSGVSNGFVCAVDLPAWTSGG